MNDEVEATQLALQASEERVELRVVGDVALGQDRVVQVLGQSVEGGLQAFALVAERQACAGVGERLGDRPGDRALE